MPLARRRTPPRRLSARDAGPPQRHVPRAASERARLDESSVRRSLATTRSPRAACPTSRSPNSWRRPGTPSSETWHADYADSKAEPMIDAADVLAGLCAQLLARVIAGASWDRGGERELVRVTRLVSRRGRHAVSTGWDRMTRTGRWLARCSWTMSATRGAVIEMDSTTAQRFVAPLASRLPRAVRVAFITSARLDDGRALRLSLARSATTRGSARSMDASRRRSP